MSELVTFRDTLRRIMPTWLQNFWGSRLLYALAVQVDELGDILVAGVQLRFPGLYSFETLDRIGRERGIPRGFDEPDATYAARLPGWWDVRKREGNPYNLLRQVQAYLAPHPVLLRIVNNAGAWYTLSDDGSSEYFFEATWNWDGSTTDWSRFWLIINTGPDLWELGGAWGAGDDWGPNTFGFPTWGGSNATPGQVAGLVALVGSLTAPHAKCVNIIVSFETPALLTHPDGTWHSPGTIVAGVYVPARDPRALYWEGP